MSLLQQRPYELSIWEDIMVEDSIEGNHLIEKKICAIGSDVSTSPITAFDITLNRKINGEKTLTFSICASYQNQETGESVINPFISLLTNERKVKLNKEGKWYDFVIKKVEEDSNKKVFTYTAKDQHVQELGRNGFNLEFDRELENDIKTPREFVEAILDGTSWEPGDFDEFLEYTTEGVYECTTTQIIKARSATKSEKTELEIPMGVKVYVPYSIIQNKEKVCQILYNAPKNNEAQTTPKDDEGTLIDANFKDVDGFKNYAFDAPTYNVNGFPAQLSIGTLMTNARGHHYVRSAKTKYDSKIDKYVNIYTKGDKEYYGFVKTEYITPEIVINLVTNSKDFTSSTGWKAVKIPGTDGIEDSIGQVKTKLVPDVEEEDFFTTSTSEQLLTIKNTVFNSGFFDNRSKLNSLVADKTVLVLEVEYASSEPGAIDSIQICDYTVADGYYQIANNNPYFSAKLSGERQIELKCLRSLSLEQLKESKIGIFITVSEGGANIKKIQLYQKILDENSAYIKPDTIVRDGKSLIRQEHYYYQPIQNVDYTLESLQFDYRGYEPDSSYILQYEEPPIRRRSLTAKKSNRFNLLQKVCEAFEAWLDIQVEHDDYGNITKKSIGMRKFIGQENFAGFKYGVNLNSIKRTIDSDQIVTKMIVENNANEFAPNGFCSISRASLNPSKSNVVYNFDYYINHGLLDQNSTQLALYNYYEGVRSLSEQITALQEEKISAEKSLMQATASYVFEKEKVEAAEKGYAEANEKLVALTGGDYEAFADPAKYEGDDPEWVTKKRSNFLKEETCKKYLSEIKRYKQVIEEDSVSGLEATKTSIEIVVASKDEAIKNLTEQRFALENQFFNLFGRFIQEGTWISEDYTDDQLYYIDALGTLYTSSRPKVSYSIDVFALNGIPGFENYKFDIGDKTFVEDGEFFGYKHINGVKTPLRQEVIISEINENLNDIAKNSIKVQNYKTQFEDLFQRVAAATEQLQYSTGRYERASNAVNSNGSLSYKALQQAVDENGLAISGAGQQTVSVDERGIIAVDSKSPSNQVRIIGGGVYLTDDGGSTWSTGITGEGINADTVTTGTLNTGVLNIMNGDRPAHVWNSKGITSYKSNQGRAIDTSTFVRMDEYGIYGVQDDAAFDATTEATGAEAIQKIKDNATYSLTWDGFTLKAAGSSGRFEIDSSNDLMIIEDVKDENGVITPTTRVHIGRLKDDDGNISYGMQIFGSKNGAALIGDIGEVKVGEETKNLVISTGTNTSPANFQVYDDGFVSLKGALIQGDTAIVDGYLNFQTDETIEITAEDGIKKTVPVRQVIIDPQGLGETDFIFAALKNGEVGLALKDDGTAHFKGTVYAENSYIQGKLIADEGKIGEWFIVEDSLSSVEGPSDENGWKGSGVALSPSGYKCNLGEGEFVILAGQGFGVTKDGKVYAKDYKLINGEISNPNISGGTIANTTIDWGSIDTKDFDFSGIEEALASDIADITSVANAAKKIADDTNTNLTKTNEAVAEAQKTAKSAQEAATTGVDEKLSNYVTNTTLTNNYYNKDTVNNTFVSNTGLSSALGGYVPTSTLANYYTKSETYSQGQADNKFQIKGSYVTTTELDGKKYVTESTLNGKNYVTEATLNSKGFAVESKTVSKSEYDTKVQELSTSISAQSEAINLRATKTEVQNGYTTKQETAALDLKANNINAEVSKKADSSGGTETFGWDLQSSGFSLYSGSKSNKVFNCDSAGVEINGKLKATGQAYRTPTWEDAQRIARADVGLDAEPLSEREKLYYDFNGDGKVDSYDASLAARVASGMIEYSSLVNYRTTDAKVELNPGNADAAISFEMLNPKGVYETSCSLGANGLKANRARVRGGEVDGAKLLFKNPSGETGTISLSDDLVNYDRIEIFYSGQVSVDSKASDSATHSQLIQISRSPSSASGDFYLSNTWISIEGISIVSSKYTYAEKSITPAQSGQYQARYSSNTNSGGLVSGWFYPTNEDIGGQIAINYIIGYRLPILQGG